MRYLRFPLVFLFLLLLSRGIGYAQDRPARGWIDVNVGAAVSGGKESVFTFSTPQFLETKAAAAAYPKPSTGADVDFGGGFMFHPKFGFGVNFAGTAHKDIAGLAITVPSPYLFSDSATGSGSTKEELTRTEGATNIQMVFAPINSGKSFVRLFVGPTYFNYKADMVENISYTQVVTPTRGTNKVTVNSYDLATGKGNGWGFHVGADASHFFSRVVGVGVVGRYSRGSASIDEPLSEEKQDVDVGGFQVGGGLRIRF